MEQNAPSRVVPGRFHCYARGVRAVAILLMLLALPPAARAADPDPWFGADKAKHFAATTALSVGGYACASLFDGRPAVRLAAAGTLAMGAGIAKEPWDLAGHGDASWRDLTWDGIGTATGLLAGFFVDWMWRAWHPEARSAAPTGAERQRSPLRLVPRRQLSRAEDAVRFPGPSRPGHPVQVNSCRINHTRD